MRVDTPIKALHWHLIPGGIEFEAADGSFVHILLDEEQCDGLAKHLAEALRRPKIAPTVQGVVVSADGSWRVVNVTTDLDGNPLEVER